MASLTVFVFAIFLASAQDTAKPSPHLNGSIVAPPGSDEVAYCDKCHTAGCPMPHPEHVAVSWQIDGKVPLANGQVTCSSCHTTGFRHRADAFLARNQKGLCAPCHYGNHVLPNAHPFETRCSSCHTIPKANLTAGKPASRLMVDNVSAECLSCHYDGPISHPVGMPNTKKAAPDLPLGANGQITCVTCHYGHDNQNANGMLLRKNNKHGALCLSCHDDL